MNNKSKISSIYFLVAIFFFFCIFLTTSCDWIQKSIDETFQGSDKKGAVKNDNGRQVDEASLLSEEDQQQAIMFGDSIKLKSIQNSLKALPKFKGKDIIFIPVIVFYDYQGGYVSLAIQDPDNLENLDEYKYTNGEWQPSTPVNTSIRSYWKQKLHNLNEVDFSTVSKIYKTAMEKMKTIEGAEKLTHIYLSDYDNDLRWHLSIRGARKNYTLYFKINGELISFEEQ